MTMKEMDNQHKSLGVGRLSGRYKNFEIAQDICLEETKKSSSPKSMSKPSSPRILSKASSGRLNCLCSPTTHTGSFRCRHHRGSGLGRVHSVGANLSELAGKTMTMDELSSSRLGSS